MNGPRLGCSRVILEREVGGKTNARKPSPLKSEKYKKGALLMGVHPKLKKMVCMEAASRAQKKSIKSLF